MLAWMICEQKKIMAALPKIFLRFTIFVIVAGMAVLGVFCYAQRRIEKTPIVVGYVSEESPLLAMTMDYLERMKSVQSVCRFIQIESEEIGKEQLQAGEMEALLVMPQGMLESVIDGENKSPTLYLSTTLSTVGFLFDELANAGVSMLSVAQAQIYALYELPTQLFAQGLPLETIVSMVNQKNINLVMNREQVFYKQTVSVTTQQGAVTYYVCAFFSFCWMLAPAFFAVCFQKSRKQYLLFEKRLQYSVRLQAMMTTGLTAIAMFGYAVCFFFVVKCVVCLYHISAVELVTQDVFAWILFLALQALLLACYTGFLSAVFERISHARMAGLFLAMMQGFVGGCFLPEVLLPDSIQTIARFLPFYPLRSGVTSLVCKEKLAKTELCCLFLWIFILFFLQVIVLQMQIKVAYGNQKTGMGKTDANKKRHVCQKGCRCPIFIILGKRMFKSLGLWICLLLPVVGSWGLSMAEKNASVQIQVGIYDEGSSLFSEFEASNSQITFLPYDEEKQLKQDVLAGKIACGFVLTKDCLSHLQKEPAVWCIPVYEREDAVLTEAIEEVVYAVLFQRVSQIHFLDLIPQQYETEAQEIVTLLQKQDTFRVKRGLLENRQAIHKQQQTSNTVALLNRLLRYSMLLASVLYGGMQYRQDRKRQCFHRNPFYIGCLDFGLPMLLAGILQFLLT